MPRASGGVQSGVVGQRRDRVASQELRRLLHRLASGAVDDSAVARMLGAKQFEQLGARFPFRHDAVLDVGPVETGYEVLGRLQPEPGGDLLVRLPGSRRGERYARYAGPAFV